MIQRCWNKLFQVADAFDSGVVIGVLVGLAVALAFAPVVIHAMRATGRLSHDAARDVYARYLPWLIMIPVMLAPVVLGPGVTILAVYLLSILCYREFARATGFFRNRGLSAAVVAGILAMAFATYDHWYNFFVAVPSLTLALIVVVALARDEPKGYIQRVALAALAFLLFGVCFGHLAYMANDRDYRAIIILVVLCVEANDIFAFISGRLFGHRQLAPRTSPHKTLGGSLGAIILTMALFALIGQFVFDGTGLDTPYHLLIMGAILSLVGQFGDLVISSIKRDLNIKDMGSLIPGHGGLLDRFDSLMLVAPAMFHYIGYFRGFGLNEPERIITGAGIVG